MVTLNLRRFLPKGNAVRGVLNSTNVEIHTLENLAYIIPAGTYTLCLTYSPRFKRMLPLVCGVSGRVGIRFHRGTRPEHSQGCILLADNNSLEYLITLLQNNEKVLLTITDPITAVAQ